MTTRVKSLQELGGRADPEYATPATSYPTFLPQSASPTAHFASHPSGVLSATSGAYGVPGAPAHNIHAYQNIQVENARIKEANEAEESRRAAWKAETEAFSEDAAAETKTLDDRFELEKKNREAAALSAKKKNDEYIQEFIRQHEEQLRKLKHGFELENKQHEDANAEEDRKAQLYMAQYNKANQAVALKSQRAEDERRRVWDAENKKRVDNVGSEKQKLVTRFETYKEMCGDAAAALAEADYQRMEHSRMQEAAAMQNEHHRMHEAAVMGHGGMAHGPGGHPGVLPPGSMHHPAAYGGVHPSGMGLDAMHPAGYRPGVDAAGVHPAEHLVRMDPRTATPGWGSRLGSVYAHHRANQGFDAMPSTPSTNDVD